MDRPNSRSAHTIATPRGGGVAFVLVYLSALIGSFFFPLDGVRLAEEFLVALLFGGGLVALIGFIDDHRHLPARLRFPVHVAAAVVAVWVLGVPPITIATWIATDGWWLRVLFVVALAWLLNLYNFMDGIDGIAGLQAIAVLCEGAAILMLNQSALEAAYWLLLPASAVAGFLLWNWPPAKIFMGDAASGFIGFSLGVFALYTANHYPISIWSWLILLGVFAVDATWTLGVRVLRGERWYEAHADHAYQILARRRQALNDDAGMPIEQARAEAHKWVVLRMLLINLFWLLPLAWLASVAPSYGWLLTLIAFLPLSLLAWRLARISHQTDRKNG
ncbi:MAG: glycosyltransferase family 4 protein [Candidatus Thiodiazotropha sp. (ex Epidulcina cf. delphinae)]|nr:glycosyltransferase family 4 protein [Candidatus Thiodiazotropha sp. (ex Epidulcina cf. delphinae)]